MVSTAGASAASGEAASARCRPYMDAGGVGHRGWPSVPKRWSASWRQATAARVLVVTVSVWSH